jgi:K+-transporting ATPase ATPase A chain
VTSNGFYQIAAYFLALLVLTRPLGAYVARVFQGQSTWMRPVLRPAERLVYYLCGIDEKKEQLQSAE